MLRQQDILNYLTQHKKEFQEKYNIEKIGLFGSYASEEAHEELNNNKFLKFPLVQITDYGRGFLGGF